MPAINISCYEKIHAITIGIPEIYAMYRIGVSAFLHWSASDKFLFLKKDTSKYLTGLGIWSKNPFVIHCWL